MAENSRFCRTVNHIHTMLHGAFKDAVQTHISPMWIDGKKYSRNVYADTREECEKK